MARGIKRTNIEYINDAKKVHIDKYDYDKLIYLGSKNKVEIGCKIHGYFFQDPTSHLRGVGCKKCKDDLRRKSDILLKEEFFKKHGNKYDYSKLIYVNNKTKIIIGCEIHGWFEQTPEKHLNSGGCFKCYGSIKYTNKTYLKKVNEIHNNFYKYPNLNYKNNKSKIHIECPIHGLFQQKCDSHLQGKGCKKCYHLKKIKTTTDFKTKSNSIHNNYYDYSKSIYTNNQTHIKIGCPMHGYFDQIPTEHKRGKGCPKCKSSKGETKIRNILLRNNINFSEEHTFNNLKSSKNRKLRFDFYLPDYNTCIEYDGKQHFKIVEHFGGRSAFMKLRHRDKLKNQYCLNNNINLIRIPYTNFNNIEEILSFIF